LFLTFAKKNKMKSINFKKNITQKKLILINFLLFAFLFKANVFGQSVQNFGTTTGSLITGSSTTFVPDPTSSGTTYARIGSGSGSINKITTSNPLGTSGNFIRASAPTNASVNKVSPIISSTGATTFYARFKILFGDASAGTTATTGTWYAFLGNGAMFGDNNGFTGNQSFTGFRFAFGSGGDVTFNNRNAGNWNQTGINTTYQTLKQGIYYDFEIVGNNQSTGNVNYTYNGVSQSVAINTFDLYINGFLVGDNMAKAQLANNSSIRSSTFYGESSTSNAANIFLDDVSFQNSIPSSIQRLSNPAIFDLSASNYSFTNWPSTSAIGSYPSNMIFHWGILNTVDPTLTNTATQDYVWGYNYSSQSRITGLNANGFSFLNTSPGHVSPTSGNCGEAVVSINTTCRNNVQVSWTAARQTNNGNRYLLRAQYRVGNTGAYTNLPGLTSAIEFSSANAGPTSFGPITLPAACENQSEVQIRWVYYWSGSGSGSRDEIRLDEISITSSSSSPVAPSAAAQYFCATTMPTVGDLVATGNAIQWYSASSGGAALPNSTALTNGNYYASQSASGCESISRVSVAVALTATAFPTIVSSIIGSALQSGDILWSGNSSNSWSTESNWYVFDGVDFNIASQLPSASNKVFILQSNIAGICSSNSSAVIAVQGEVSDLTIGTNATLTVNAGRILSVANNLINHGSFLPDASSTVLFEGNNDQAIGGSSPTTFANLTIDKSAGSLTLNSPVSVSKTLSMLSGNIATSATNLLTVGTSTTNIGSLNWVSGSVLGPIQRYFSDANNSSQESGIFPVGTTSLNRNAQVNFTSGLTSGGTITAEYKLGVSSFDDAGLPVEVNGQMVQNYENEGWWEITPAGGNLNAATYSLSLRGNGLSVVNSLSLLRIIKSVSHTSWDMSGIGSHSAPVGSDSDFSIVNSGLTGFSFFNIGSGNASALPVQLIDFSANCQESDFISLNWSTASEQNSMKFIIEKSRDLNTWVQVGEKQAAGNSNSVKEYAMNDLEPFSGIGYYRLVQIDFDGKVEIYDPISSSCEVTQNSISVFPNPAKGDFTIEVYSKSENKEFELDLINLLGNVVCTKTVDVNIGINHYYFNDLRLESGVYIVNFNNLENKMQPVKIVIE